VTQEEFCEAMQIAPDMLQPKGASRSAIRTAILERGRKIRDDLVEYVHGRQRSAQSSVVGIAGRWKSKFTDQEDLGGVELELSQSGRLVEGRYSYGEDTEGTLEGELRAHVLSGEWREGRKRGPFSFKFSDSAAAFSGSWSSRSGDLAGEWSGDWVGPCVDNEQREETDEDAAQ
jgi:hypothetical protein